MKRGTAYLNEFGFYPVYMVSMEYMQYELLEWLCLSLELGCQGVIGMFIIFVYSVICVRSVQR